jgi:hypothetical protein
MTPEMFAMNLVGTSNTVTAQTMRGIVVDAIKQWDAQKAANWHGCCNAAGRLADLVCNMYHPKDAKARKTWPTATWAEIIASELGIEVPETD